MYRRCFAFLAAGILMAGNVTPVMAEQDFHASVTVENVLSLAKEYDPDSYYILNRAEQLQKGSVEFWLMGAESNAAAMDTAVHESTHTICFHDAADFNSEAIYTGNQQYIQVPYTDVFKTEEWSVSVPDSLRTFRYPTYIAQGADPDANQKGVYGLLNEFNAYSWGMNSEMKLLNYYQKVNTQDGWNSFVSSGENGWDSFLEFRWWILSYLNYAQKNHSDVWSGIMSNQNFIDAYCVTERRFESLVNQYGEWKKNNSAKSNIFTMTDRTSLQEQIQKSEMQVQEQYLFSHCNNPAGKPTAKPTVKPTTKPTSKPVAQKTVTMYRAYNPNSGEHFYTSNTKEFNHIVSLGWKNEGVGWIAPQSSKTPVYRMYNANGGEHHYTSNVKEKNALIRAGWKDEGIGWYSDDSKRTPLYRQYNPNAFANNHNYTTSKKENDTLVKLSWRYEGIGWYGISAR